MSGTVVSDARHDLEKVGVMNLRQEEGALSQQRDMLRGAEEEGEYPTFVLLQRSDTRNV